MPDDPVEKLPPHGRRDFFRSGLSRILRPLADLVESKLPMALPLAPSTPVVQEYLRPPGALPEDEFLDTCLRCGRCADVCPANAIALVREHKPRMFGTPYIEPDKQACVICDELACMKVCPSGALKLVERTAIRIGLADVDHDICVRSHGENCTICIDRCPIGSAALHLDDQGRVEVIDPRVTGLGCTGCGVCEQQCPTRPVRAIRVLMY